MGIFGIPVDMAQSPFFRVWPSRRLSMPPLSRSPGFRFGNTGAKVPGARNEDRHFRI
jgi:hypothetical protein